VLLVAVSDLGVRLDALRRAQNADGGWSYFPGKQSWLEPTFYAALALHGDPAADEAWDLLQSWQREDGSWRPSADVQVASWGTALCVTLAHVRGDLGDPFHKGVANLVETSGAESNLINRARARMGGIEAERDLSLKAWPWKPNTSSWVEPTAHALVALKKASGRVPGAGQRVRMGEAQLLNVQCSDGGWNYGSPSALRVELPAYPETTGVALVGLQGHPNLGKSLDLAAKWLQETASPLANAWLTIALRLHGAAVPEGHVTGASADHMILALEALAAPEGNHGLLRTEAVA
jgi:hypothetical protein